MSRQREDVRIRSTDGEFAAYLSTPETPNGVAVVVLQEIFGVNANIRGLCDRFADAGYAAVAPDLYWRQAPGVQLAPASDDGRAQAMELMKGLDRDQSASDAAAALAAARERVPGLGRSAAVGYCYGGGVAYLMAVRDAVDAGVAYYGTHIHTLLDEAPNLRGRLLLHVAGEDHLCPPPAQEAIREALAPLGERARVVVHPGVGHAFARAGGATYDAAAAERADGMTLDLLASLG